MCDECVKLDQMIELYRMIARVSYPLTTEAVGKLIKGIYIRKKTVRSATAER